MSGSALSSPAIADPAKPWPRLRRRLAQLGLACAIAAAAAVGGGLLGALNGWADLLNHFLPVWLLLALVGAALSALAPRGSERLGLLLAGLAALGALLPMAAEFAAGRAEAAAVASPAGTLKLMTFNVWDGNLTPYEAAEVIRGSGADLVAVEEPSRLMAVAYPSLAGLYPYASPCRQGCDVAVLSKRPLRNLQVHGNRGPGPPRDPGQPNLVTAEVDGPDGRPISIAAVHLVWPTPPGQQRLERRQLMRMLAPALREDAVLLGDFNLTPWSFAMRGLDFGLKPMTRRTRGVLSYPARLAGLTPPSFLAIDQVFAGPDWRTARVERLARGGSDHYPVLVALRRR